MHERRLSRPFRRPFAKTLSRHERFAKSLVVILVAGSRYEASTELLQLLAQQADCTEMLLVVVMPFVVVFVMFLPVPTARVHQIKS